MKPIPSTAKDGWPYFLSCPMTLHGICENKTDGCCLDARGFCAARLEQLHSQGKVQNSFVITVHLRRSQLHDIKQRSPFFNIVKTGNDGSQNEV
jgi:hypothetical protein